LAPPVPSAPPEPLLPPVVPTPPMPPAPFDPPELLLPPEPLLPPVVPTPPEPTAPPLAFDPPEPLLPPEPLAPPEPVGSVMGLRHDAAGAAASRTNSNNKSGRRMGGSRVKKGPSISGKSRVRLRFRRPFVARRFRLGKQFTKSARACFGRRR